MTVDIHGFCDERFLPLREAFVANFDAGLELGASLALTHQGKQVVDLWAGWMDPERTRPWARDTIVNVMSTTKVPLAMSAMMAVDRGLIALNEPVARYWREFAEGGKAHVTVRDAFCHCGGVPGFDPPVSFDVYRDWAAATAAVAATPHWFGGERRVMYHAQTFGFLLGEILRRVDGRGPRRFFREEFAEPAGIDLQMGLADDADLARVALASWPESHTPAAPPGSLAERYSKGFLTPAVVDPMDWAFLSAEIPAVVGQANARSLARLAAILADGGELDGVRYLSREIVREAGHEQVYGQCPYLGWVKFGLGLGLSSPTFPGPSPTVMHWGGTGGSWLVADPAKGVGFGYAPNNWLPGVGDERGRALSDALRDVLLRL